ncbi:MAG: DivIVA domain-containing protein [Actinomycetaceae bacterium]|nr:DivIVA domain-containing protein [Actinomycetaceae bacterium]
MALLTTEDVLNKTFNTVKFREGYEQLEVDEFLDKVVETIYALQVENTELKQKLEASERRVEELQTGVPATSAPVPVEEPQPEPEPEPEPEPQPQAVAAVPASSAPEDATSMLALAQRVHDEYVRDGREEAERIIGEARQEGEAIISEARNKHDSILSQMESERSLLENKINELKTFEADYRGKIREHLQGLLHEVSNDAN